MTLIVHAGSQKVVNALKSTLSQSVMLTGDKGVGLLTIARDIAGTSLSHLLQPHNSKGELDLMGGTINADAIRELYGHTRGKHVTSRIIVIDNAERMSRAAQAAFLKLLEEPSSSTHFILTSHHPTNLLQTIRSRVQATHVRQISNEQSSQLIRSRSGVDAKKTTQLTFLASGRPAELCRLMDDDNYFSQQAAYISDARQFLLATHYERLIIASKYSKDRNNALQLIDYSARLLRRNLSSAPQPRLVRQLDQLIDVSGNLQTNANIRLQLTQFVL